MLVEIWTYVGVLNMKMHWLQFSVSILIYGLLKLLLQFFFFLRTTIDCIHDYFSDFNGMENWIGADITLLCSVAFFVLCLENLWTDWV